MGYLLSEFLRFNLGKGRKNMIWLNLRSETMVGFPGDKMNAKDLEVIMKT